MTYVIKEYSNTQDESTYKDITHPLFYNERNLKRYINKHNINGVIEVYDDSEYADYINDVDDYCDIPYPTETFEVEFL